MPRPADVLGAAGGGKFAASGCIRARLWQFVIRHASQHREAAEVLSRRYVLEELALGIRVKVMRRCYDEYYLGKTLLPALKLFQGVYQANVWRLAGLEHGNVSETEGWRPASFQA